MPKNEPRHHNAPWTAEHIKWMRRCARQRKSSAECAREMGRSRGSVAYKAMRLGIRFRSIEQPHGVQQRIARRERRAARS